MCLAVAAVEAGQAVGTEQAEKELVAGRLVHQVADREVHDRLVIDIVSGPGDESRPLPQIGRSAKSSQPLVGRRGSLWGTSPNNPFSFLGQKKPHRKRLRCVRHWRIFRSSGGLLPQRILARDQVHIVGGTVENGSEVFKGGFGGRCNSVKELIIMAGVEHLTGKSATRMLGFCRACSMALRTVEGFTWVTMTGYFAIPKWVMDEASAKRSRPMRSVSAYFPIDMHK